MNPQAGVLSTVAVLDSDRPSGSLACSACAGIAEVGDPISGWPPVELPPIPLAPGGQPVPSDGDERLRSQLHRRGVEIGQLRGRLTVEHGARPNRCCEPSHVLGGRT